LGTSRFTHVCTATKLPQNLQLLVERLDKPRLLRRMNGQSRAEGPFENATVVVVRRVFLRFRCSRPFCFSDQFHGFGGSLRFSARSHIDLKAAPLRFSKAAPDQRLRRSRLTASRILKRALSRANWDFVSQKYP